MTRARDKLTGESHFGRGFILCLVKFAEHAERIDGIIDLEQKMSEIRVWFSSASDHLYNLVLPEVFKGTEVEKLTDKLLKLSSGLRCGGVTKKRVTEKHIDYSIHLVRLIAMEVDKYFNLVPDIGRC